jgi:16S rRNA (guanine(966)-N(2))-methyltransferase RsmD
MRIIAGTAKGRRLKCPKGRRTRPTPDRVRESIFSIVGDKVHGARILDLFAGTGAMGLEALSRGASEAVFVERDPSVIGYLRENARLCGFEKESAILNSPVLPFLKNGDLGDGFDVVFADPPYGGPGASLTLLALCKRAKSLREECLFVLEHAPGENPETQPDCMEIIDKRKYGNTAITFLKMIRQGED